MSKRDPLVLLEDIMLAIEKIGRYTSQLDHDTFLEDELAKTFPQFTFVKPLLIRHYQNGS